MPTKKLADLFVERVKPPAQPANRHNHARRHQPDRRRHFRTGADVQVNRALAYLRTLFAWTVERGRLPASSVTGMKPGRWCGF